MFTLAHLTDLHLGPLPRARPAALMNKRILGFLSWQRRRRREHDPTVLAALTTDLAAQGADHVAITGDLVNIALPGEFEAAARWLAELGRPEGISVVPGNHDAYVRAPWASGIGLWSEYFAGDEECAGNGATGATGATGAAGATQGAFPFVRRRGPAAIIGVSSAMPTGPFLATGRLGPDQLNRLAECLERHRGRFRVLLIHHPPRADTLGWRKGLKDADALCAVLAAKGAELVLHGHCHRVLRATLEGPGGAIPVLGMASASARGLSHGHQARYALCHVSGESGRWALAVEVRAWDSAGHRFAGEERFAYGLG